MDNSNYSNKSLSESQIVSPKNSDQFCRSTKFINSQQIKHNIKKSPTNENEPYIQKSTTDNYIQTNTNSQSNQSLNKQTSSYFNSQSREAIIRKIPCLLLESEKMIDKIIVYFHSNSEDLSTCYKFVNALRKFLQIRVLVVEYPGYGLYQGKASEQQIFEDANYIYRYLRNTIGYNEKQIIILGRSIGTGPATYLASKFNPSTLILISPFKSIQDVAHDMIGKLGNMFVKQSFNNYENIKTVKCPILIIHGMVDNIIPHKHSLQLQKNCKTICELQSPATMNHNFFDYNNDIFIPIGNFLNQYGYNFQKEYFANLYKFPNSVYSEQTSNLSLLNFLFDKFQLNNNSQQSNNKRKNVQLQNLIQN